MIVDLAWKILVDDKARFFTTVTGVAFAVALVYVQVGLFVGLLGNASITIEKMQADLWIFTHNTPNVDFGNPFPESYVGRVRSVPGVARADNLIVWFATVALPGGAKESAVIYALRDFGAWGLPWKILEGDPEDLRRGNFVFLDDSATRRFGAFEVGQSREFSGHRLRIIGRTAEARSFTTSPIAFLDYRLAQLLAPSELNHKTTDIVVKLAPGADREAVADEIRRRLPFHDVRTRNEWAKLSRNYWVESTGLGLTMFITVSLGCLVGVIVVAQTLYTSTTEHLAEFATVKAIGGRDRTIYGVILEQASIAACLGFLLGTLVTLSLVPVLAVIDMPLVVRLDHAALIFVGTLGLCLVASTWSFRRIAGLDPAIVFRG
jgi:putative ABC transport system permease protein